MSLVRYRQPVLTRRFPHDANRTHIVTDKGPIPTELANGRLIGAVAGALGGTPPTSWTISAFTEGALTTVTEFPTFNSDYGRLTLDAAGGPANPARVSYEQAVTLALGEYIAQLFLISRTPGTISRCLNVVNGTGTRVNIINRTAVDLGGYGWYSQTFSVSVAGTIIIRIGLNVSNTGGAASDGVTIERAYLSKGGVVRKFNGATSPGGAI